MRYRMKKLLCLLSVIMLMTAVSAYADQHLEAFFIFSASESGRTESLDLFEQDGSTYAVSTLFPEYAAGIGQDQPHFLDVFQQFCSLSPEKIRETTGQIGKMYTEWIEPQLSEPVYGTYAGELFERAASIRYADFALSDLTGYMKTAAGGISDSIPAFIAEAADQSNEGGNLKIHYESYDNGSFISAAILNGEKIISTLSADFHDEQESGFLICWKEEGRYYYRYITVKDDSEKGITVCSSLRSGNASTYQNISEKRPLLTETLLLTGNQFTIEISADSVSAPVIIRGTANAREDGNAFLNAEASIAGQQNKLLDISMNLEAMSRAVSFSDKKTVDCTDENAKAGISLSATTHIMLLAAEILPALPEDYQKLILKWLYP